MLTQLTSYNIDLRHMTDLKHRPFYCFFNSSYGSVTKNLLTARQLENTILAPYHTNIILYKFVTLWNYMNIFPHYGSMTFNFGNNKVIFIVMLIDMCQLVLIKTLRKCGRLYYVLGNKKLMIIQIIIDSIF